MNRLMVSRSCLAVLLLLFLTPVQIYAQRTIGVDWNVPDQQTEIASQLQYFSDLGITHLQVSRHLENETWQRIEKHDFTVYGRLPLKFSIEQTISRADSTQLANLQQLAANYQNGAPVQAIGVFAFGARTDTAFQSAVTNFLNDLSPDITKSLYYITARPEPVSFDTLFDFKMLAWESVDSTSQPAFGAFLYKPHPDRKWDLAPVKQLLESTVQHQNTPVFFESSWLHKMVERHPDFEETIKHYATTSDPIFPLPKQKKSPYRHSTIAIMLLLAWLIFAISYNYNPIYRKAFIRYFTGHDFYLNDILERHIRSLSTGISILVQHGIAGGIVFYCLLHASFSALGIEALRYHFSAFSLFGTGDTAILLLGCFLTLVIEIISIGWLMAANSKVTYLSQIINLYPWPLQLNVITATLIGGLFLAGGSGIVMYLLVMVFLLLFFTSFLVTSYDTAQLVESNRAVYFVTTIGLYSILWISLSGWMMFSPLFQNVISLAASLP